MQSKTGKDKECLTWPQFWREESLWSSRIPMTVRLSLNMTQTIGVRLMLDRGEATNPLPLCRNIFTNHKKVLPQSSTSLIRTLVTRSQHHPPHTAHLKNQNLAKKVAIKMRCHAN